MAKKFLLRAAAVLTGLCLLLLSGCMREEPETDGRFKVVASFYPVYIAAMNLLDGTDAQLCSLTQPTAGCLHDYQLTVEDMIALDGADALLINGAGMESFLDKVVEDYPELPVVCASEGMELLESQGHHHHHDGDEDEGEHHHEEDHDEDHDHDHDDHENEDVNAHVWVSVSLYREYVKNLCDGLCALRPADAERYRANAQAYDEQLAALEEEMHGRLSSVTHRDMVTFHEAFAYFADEFDLNVVAVIEREPGTSPTVAELTSTIDAVRESGCDALFSEPQYDARVAETIADETGAHLYVLDPLVSGEFRKDAYLTAMRSNLEQLTEALS